MEEEEGGCNGYTTEISIDSKKRKFHLWRIEERNNDKDKMFVPAGFFIDFKPKQRQILVP